MERLYPAILHKEDGSEYGIHFPNFPGCVSAGTTIEDAVRLGREALSLHIEGMTADGEKIPEPFAPEDIDKSETEGSVGLAFVAADVPGRAKRVQVTLEEGLLNRIDAVASNRSRFLADAAKQKLADAG